MASYLSLSFLSATPTSFFSSSPVSYTLTTNILTHDGMKLFGSSSVLCSTYACVSSSPYFFIMMLLFMLLPFCFYMRVSRRQAYILGGSGPQTTLHYH